ncbi:MAG: pullulanase-type alpha-1,6-glucosidase [Actinomycetia bacterium]|nr:pullulanase-type alpha-1,6-glucosidase [Actinomycetes bacterium]
MSVVSTAHRPARAVLAAGAALALFAPLLGVLPTPAHATVPVISVPGSFNASLGCASDWAPDCAAIDLTYDAGMDLYWGSFAIAPGSYQFKVTEDGSWAVNYGADGVPGGANIDFTATSDPTYFVYNPTTHVAFASPSSQLVTLPGTLQAPLGCADTNGNGGNWEPACLATAMVPHADGTYTYSTDKLPAGGYQVKVVVGMSWAVNYGDGGAPNGANMSFTTAANKLVAFTFDGTTHVLTIDVSEPPAFGLGQSAAIWLDRGTLAVPTTVGKVQAADLTWSWAGHPEFTLVPSGTVPAALADLNRLTTGYEALGVSVASGDLAAALKAALKAGPYELVGKDAAGDTVVDTGMQTARLLDDLYAPAKAATLGLTWAAGVPTACVWAPTAQDVSILTAKVADVAAGGTIPTVASAATENPATGVWCVTGTAAWTDQAYQWYVDVFVPSEGAVVGNIVTDPYSVGLTTNSGWSVFVDLASPEWAPAIWSGTPIPPALRTQAEQTIYELHIRDFSAADSTVPADMRGTYAAFTQKSSDGMTHLAELADAGLTTVHLLPSFDIATIPENRADQVTPAIPDAGPASTAQAAAVNAVADQDAYNWGYDPWHYSTPEGSYAMTADQNGGARTAEFRSMVGSLHSIGLRVVLDEVFNHTSASGQGGKSVLDRVVPNYYHRYDANGQIETYSCCQDTATENTMMGKLMVDSIVTWVKDYHVDGFRFDIMGFHSLANMADIRAALDALTVAKDGVDGSAVYLYGEAWNFGATQDDALFPAARQANLAGTGIGSFNDRLRDGVRGGGPFDSDQRDFQGFGTGLYTDPNAQPDPAVAATTTGGTVIPYDALRDLYYREDLVRLGLAGNLASYLLPSNQGSGTPVLGSDYGYGAGYGSPDVGGHQAAGYAQDPQEIVNYVDCHDGTTIFDNGIWKLPADSTMDTRVRMQILSMATTAFGQSPSFWQAGDDILRSKSLDANSYNSGDHFNAIDWSMTTNVFGTGLPPTGGNAAAMTPLLSDPTNKPDQAAMAQTYAVALDLLRVRSSTPLLTLGTGDLIKQRVHFLNDGANPTPGLIVMDIEDPAAAKTTDVDPALDAAMVVFNASPDTITEAIDGQAGRAWVLNAVQANGADPVVKGLKFDAATGTLTIPGRTAAVLVLPAAAVAPTPTPAPSTPGGAATGTGGCVAVPPSPAGPLAVLLLAGGAFALVGWRKRWSQA